MQTIWDGWSTLDPANVAKFTRLVRTPSRHSPAEICQLGRIRQGVKVVLPVQSGKCHLNDDAEVHPHGDLVWDED